MGKNVKGATEVPTVAENIEKLNGTVTLNASERKYFLFPKAQNKFICIMPLNFLISCEAGENVIFVLIL